MGVLHRRAEGRPQKPERPKFWFTSSRFIIEMGTFGKLIKVPARLTAELTVFWWAETPTSHTRILPGPAATHTSCPFSSRVSCGQSKGLGLTTPTSSP